MDECLLIKKEHAVQRNCSRSDHTAVNKPVSNVAESNNSLCKQEKTKNVGRFFSGKFYLKTKTEKP